MKATIVKIGGTEYYLAFTGTVMFEIREKYGGAEELLEQFKGDSRESFNIICETIALLAEQGEMTRRHLGYDHNKIITAEVIQNLVQPSDIPVFINSIIRAIELGFGREINPEDEGDIDLVLAEIEKKTR